MSSTVLALLILVPGVAFGGGPEDEGRPVAKADAEAGARLETATFSMYCYWTGEATVGRVDGVVASRIGHWDGREIVQVDLSIFHSTGN